ncbi:hypothetical protein KP509_25G071700 [Ceratopteris richardii]|nr:hypothetical protein KP509_25G071700 [Ceratopteris richardii]
MGLFGGWRKKKVTKEQEAETVSANTSSNIQKQPNVPDTSVFEFGSAGEEHLTIAGYCPVSNDLEPCRWELMTAPVDAESPLFRIVF